MAEESIRALARSLPLIKADPTDAKARGDALYGCWLAGSVLGAASGSGAKICGSQRSAVALRRSGGCCDMVVEPAHGLRQRRGPQAQSHHPNRSEKHLAGKE